MQGFRVLLLGGGDIGMSLSWLHYGWNIWINFCSGSQQKTPPMHHPLWRRLQTVSRQEEIPSQTWTALHTTSILQPQCTSLRCYAVPKPASFAPHLSRPSAWQNSQSSSLHPPSNAQSSTSRIWPLQQCYHVFSWYITPAAASHSFDTHSSITPLSI